MSPILTAPALTTMAWTPRRRSLFPSGEFTNSAESGPNHYMNFLQPVCGAAVISSTAEPSASRVPRVELAGPEALAQPYSGPPHDKFQRAPVFRRAQDSIQPRPQFLQGQAPVFRHMLRS